MIRYRKIMPGEYEVTLDGEVIGTVRKFERSYNLRRRYVSRGWNATTARGKKLYEYAYGPTARLRRDAAQALVRAMEE